MVNDAFYLRGVLPHTSEGCGKVMFSIIVSWDRTALPIDIPPPRSIYTHTTHPHPHRHPSLHAHKVLTSSGSLHWLKNTLKLVSSSTPWSGVMRAVPRSGLLFTRNETRALPSPGGRRPSAGEKNSLKNTQTLNILPTCDSKGKQNIIMVTEVNVILLLLVSFPPFKGYQPCTADFHGILSAFTKQVSQNLEFLDSLLSTTPADLLVADMMSKPL